MLGKFLASMLLAAVGTVCQAQTNSVVALDDTDVRQTGNNIEYTRKRVVEILNDKADDEACFVFQTDRNTQLKAFAATVADRNGKTLRKFKKADLKMTELSLEMADGARTLYMDYTPPSYPVTVTFEWEARTSDEVVAFPQFVPQRDYGSEVKKAHYRISVPSANPCRMMLKNIAVTPSVHEEGVQTVTEMTVENIKPIQRERSAPGLAELLPTALVAPTYFVYHGTSGSMKTWTDFGKWQYALLDGRDQLTDAQKTVVRQLVGGCSTDREKVERIYRYLYGNTRYVSIQLGIGGYQPATAESVGRTGFGDCKALSNYMAAMLREAGLDAFYAAVSTDYSRLYADFPNLNQLNHVVAGAVADGDTLWLECTNARMPAGYVHNTLAGHDALLIAKDGGRIVRMPGRADTLNLQRTDVDVALKPDGSAAVRMVQRSECGQYEPLLALAGKDAAERSRYVLSLMSVAGAKLEKMEMREDTSCAQRPAMVVQAELDGKGYATVTGSRLFVPINTIKSTYGRMADGGERRQKVVISQGFADEEHFTIHLPEGYAVEALPQPVAASNELGEFCSECKADTEHGTVTVSQRMTMRKGEYPPSAYASLLTLANTARKGYSSKLVLVKK